MLVVKVKTDRDHRDELVKIISSQGGAILGFKLREMSLEEAFITITQKNVSSLLGE